MTRALLRKLLLPAAIVAALLAIPAQASASPLDVQRDCGDSDVFEQKHSRADLEAALRQLQADAQEYTDCARMIRAALAAMSKKGGKGPAAKAAGNGGGGDVDDGSAGGGGSKGGKKGAKDGKDKAGDEPVALAQAGGLDLDGEDESSSATVATAGGDGGSSLPLILTVVALALAAIGGGLWYAGKRNPAIGNALRRVPLPFRNS